MKFENTIELNKRESNEVLIYAFESNGNHIVPPHYQPKTFNGDSIIWLLPANENSGFSQKITCEKYTVKKSFKKTVIYFNGEYKTEKFDARPLCDFFGNKISFDIAHGKEFEKAFARFYWDNQLNQIAERTFLKKKKDIREGYVLSTLNKNAYAGTYPAVDHEFHMKGRFAIGGKAEASLIKRMLLLQIKIMREDRKKLSRNVCAIQPSRAREYNVWRKSINKKCKAQMFRITANIEFIEGVYNYYSMTKDIDFIKDNIIAIEKNCDYIEHFINDDGLLESHVYYEDQVIKDGAVLQAQLFAVNSFRLMAKIEQLVLNNEKAKHYLFVSRLLAETAVKDYPNGFWSSENNRFIDWIDSFGKAHEHVHLLANELPELFEICNEEQAEHCRSLIESRSDVFDKFPSFVAAEIENYTDSEIGVGGPYDLCAAGRYWCWDSEYIAYKKNGAKLESQLVQVAKQAQCDGYLMGERYDMNYVYYNKGADAVKNWHGASLYYEYPNVFQYVLICKYIGVKRGFDCDIELAPLFENGRVLLEQYGIEFEVQSGSVTSVKNLTDKQINVKINGKIIALKQKF